MASLDELIELLWEAHDDGPWTPKQSIIDDAKFREWMSSDDIEVLGFLFSMTGDPRIKIEPQLTTREYLDFVKHYSERCFIENPDGEWSDSRYSAGGILLESSAGCGTTTLPHLCLPNSKTGLPVYTCKGIHISGFVLRLPRWNTFLSAKISAGFSLIGKAIPFSKQLLTMHPFG
jgi:hypothetical protein